MHFATFTAVVLPDADDFAEKELQLEPPVDQLAPGGFLHALWDLDHRAPTPLGSWSTSPPHKAEGKSLQFFRFCINHCMLAYSSFLPFSIRWLPACPVQKDIITVFSISLKVRLQDSRRNTGDSPVLPTWPPQVTMECSIFGLFRQMDRSLHVCLRPLLCSSLTEMPCPQMPSTLQQLTCGPTPPSVASIQAH